MKRGRMIWAFVLVPLVASTASADIPVKGGCVIGTGQPPATENPVAKIVDYARLYRDSYMSFKNEERRVRDHRPSAPCAHRRSIRWHGNSNNRQKRRPNYSGYRFDV